MGGFESIVGHEDIIKHLQNAIETGKVSHSYLFSGEPGSGKKLIANMFAMTLQCEEKGLEPCLKCESCKKGLSKNHPDIIHITHEKPNTISIDEIREQLVQDVEIKPYESEYKVYILSEADKMTPQAQNALLKTIEEPPSYAIILLLTNNAQGLLPTILSRCVRLDLKAVGDNLVKAYLMEKLQIPDYEAEVDASYAQGNIGKAVEAASSQSFQELSQSALYIVKNADKMTVQELVNEIKKVTKEKQSIDDYLDIFLLWFRDVLMFKATREIDRLIFRQEYNAIKDQARERSYEGLENIIEAIDKAKVRLRANVNFELTMELLFLTIREK